VPGEGGDVVVVVVGDGFDCVFRSSCGFCSEVVVVLDGNVDIGDFIVECGDKVYACCSGDLGEDFGGFPDVVDKRCTTAGFPGLVKPPTT
jgi:hypothetical protein